MNKEEYLQMIGRRIRFFRESCNMTQEDLAKKAGYGKSNNPRSTISKIERGQIDISQSKVRLFADAFGITVSELVNVGSDPKPLQLCELFEECYGKESFTVVQKFLKLNSTNRTAVSLMINSLEAAEREKREESKERKAI